MTRLRWGVAAIATVLVAVLGLFAYAQRSTTPDLASFGDGSQNAADVAAARSMLSGLATPPGTTRDPYDTACHGSAVLCLSSNAAPATLLATATAQLRAAGASVLTHKCPAHDPSTDIGSCYALFNFRGVHINGDAGNKGALAPTGATYLALRVSDPETSTPVDTRAGVVPVVTTPLGSWASVNPLPAAWHVTASCTNPAAQGCDAYQNDWKKRTSIAAGLAQASAAVQTSLSAAGFQIDSASCSPANAVRLGQCLVAGNRFRTLGGKDGELVTVELQAIDGSHVTARVSVTAL